MELSILNVTESYTQFYRILVSSFARASLKIGVD